MDSRHGKKRTNTKGDRISSLPDDLIHRILAFIDIRDAIGTSVLSSRWRFIWTSMPYLNFSTEDFFTLPQSSKFVTNVLSRRNDQTEVYSVKLSFRGKVSQVFVKRIMNYAFSHNVQQMNVVYLLDKVNEFPLFIFNSRSLKHLSLKMQHSGYRSYSLVDRFLTSTWELPTLTSLELQSVTLRDDNADKCIGVFSKCANLKNLTIKDFKTMGSDSFSICHPRLLNLTIDNSPYNVRVINVTTPQLQSLAIKYYIYSHADHVISAPHLSSLIYKGSHPLKLISSEGFHSLEKANICVSSPQDRNAHKIISLLQQLHNVHFLTLNLEIIEVLSEYVDSVFQQPSPFVNLKSLKIYPESECIWELAPTKVIMSNNVKSYLLGSSPGCTFTMVLREEIKAPKIMAELGVILKKQKDNMKENHKPNLKIGWKMAQIKSCWKNIGLQIEKASVITSKLQDIEELLKKLPASKRANIQPRFSNMCLEAEIAINEITNFVKIQCGENQTLSSVCFHELATTLETSS